MNVMLFSFVPLIIYYCCIGVVHGQNCQKETHLSGVISDSRYSGSSSYQKCWIIEAPKDSFIRLDLRELSLSNSDCNWAYIKIDVAEMNDTYTFCYRDTNRKPFTALNDVTITFYHVNTRYSGSFKLYYSTESLICAQKNHFRCSASSCIHLHQVCDGVKDCANGADEIECEKGISAVKGMNISRENAITWLKNHRSHSFGWGKNTHRAVTALYLSKAASVQGNNLEDELIAKQLELQTSVALLRNTSDPISISELSMFVNALTVTCHNPRHFYGYDLLQILGERVSSSKSPSPSAYLTLCNSNWNISVSDVTRLLKVLHKHSKYPFQSDIQAVTVMALSCMRNKTKSFRNIVSAENLYETTIKKFISAQLPDGSFGNVYTTALITQALISSGQEKNKQWNMTSTARYLMKQLDSPSSDFLSAYLTLPIFSGRSLVDLTAVDCSNITRKEGKDDDISEVTNKLGGKVRVQYSLYIGDQKDVIHTMYLRMPENSSAYDVMRIAQVADPKYKFLHRDVSGQMYVYEIAGITNDPEAGKFWLLYTGNHFVNGTVRHHTESPDEFIMKDSENLIMWYRTADV